MNFDNILFIESFVFNISGRDCRAQEGVEGPATEQCNTLGQSENIADTGTWVACIGHKVNINKGVKKQVVEIHEFD